MFEIRTYHIDPNHFDEYKYWAKTYAVPYLNTQLNLVGFWLDLDVEAEVLNDIADPLGPANVSWIIEWKNMAQRNETMTKVFLSAEWTDVFSKLTGGFDLYLRREARFTASFC